MKALQVFAVAARKGPELRRKFNQAVAIVEGQRGVADAQNKDARELQALGGMNGHQLNGVAGFLADIARRQRIRPQWHLRCSWPAGHWRRGTAARSRETRVESGRRRSALGLRVQYGGEFFPAERCSEGGSRKLRRAISIANVMMLSRGGKLKPCGANCIEDFGSAGNFFRAHPRVRAALPASAIWERYCSGSTLKHGRAATRDDRHRV